MTPACTASTGITGGDLNLHNRDPCEHRKALAGDRIGRMTVFVLERGRLVHEIWFSVRELRPVVSMFVI